MSRQLAAHICSTDSLNSERILTVFYVLFCRLVAFLSGTIHITLPSDPSSEAWLQGGINGVILALDTTGSGHNTSYPAGVETRALQIPFDDGFVPEHAVLYDGPCKIRSRVVTI